MVLTVKMISSFIFSPSITFTRNVESGVPLVYLPGTHVVALSEPLGEVCDAIAASDSPLDETDLALRLDQGHWDSGRVSKAMHVLATAGIVQEAGTAMGSSESRRTRYLEFQRPFTLKLTLFDPETLCRWMSPLARLFRGRLGVVLALMGAGIQVVFWSGMIHVDGLSTVQGESQLTLTFVLLTVTCLFHEMAHGVVLADRGGNPRRLGIMLYYFVPCFFCDVSDSFRLGRRAQIEVALGGVVFQCQFGALIAPLTLVPGPSSLAIRHYLGVNLLIAMLNLIPFVTLDGYFALRAIVGLPNLRAKAVGAWKTWLVGTLRHRRDVRRPSRWITVYGAGAILMPPLMIAWCLCTWVTRYWPGNMILSVVVSTCLLLVIDVVINVRQTAQRKLNSSLPCLRPSPFKPAGPRVP